jgi:hypothetical protein
VKEKREKQEIKCCLERKIKRKKVFFFFKKKRKMKNKICKRERKEQEK